MKRTRAQKIRLGVFVIISTILFVTSIYLIGQKQELFRKTFKISSYFQNVNGLMKGNNVRYSGIDIGTVNAINMINDSTIMVVMNIDEKIIRHIKKNAIATIGSDGLVGNMIVNIVPGEGSAELIANGDIIESYSKIGAEDFLSTLSSTSENAALLMVDLLKITNAMTEGKGTLGVLLNDTVMAQDLRKSVTNFKLASYNATKSINELNELLKDIRTDENSIVGTLINDSISGQKLKSVVSNLENSSEEIQAVIQNINSVVDEFKEGEGAFNYLVNDTTLVTDFRETVKNINEGTAKFNENMEALKHNFLTRGYFRKLERQQKKAEKTKSSQ